MAHDYTETNRALWNAWARINADSTFYDLDSFRAGQSSLKPVEREELGDVAGKSLLHLQCHFGLDTLSWAREGASVTGIDFSDEAIRLARGLAAEMSLPARFHATDLYEAPRVLGDETFDIVFTSYGVLCWLPDLERWAALIVRYLKPGGTFYMVEFHPFTDMLDDDGTGFIRSYFPDPLPERGEVQGSYADPEADFTHVSYEWTHPIGEVVTALVEAGLQIEFLHEFPYSMYDCFPFLEEHAPGRYGLRGQPNTIPLMYSIRATG